MIRILKKNYMEEPKCKENYDGIDIIFIKFNGYGIGWFTDCGEWFFYIYLGERGIRFSSAGFLIYNKHKKKF